MKTELLPLFTVIIIHKSLQFRGEESRIEMLKVYDRFGLLLHINHGARVLCTWHQVLRKYERYPVHVVPLPSNIQRQLWRPHVRRRWLAGGASLQSTCPPPMCWCYEWTATRVTRRFWQDYSVLGDKEFMYSINITAVLWPNIRVFLWKQVYSSEEAARCYRLG